MNDNINYSSESLKNKNEGQGSILNLSCTSTPIISTDNEPKPGPSGINPTTGVSSPQVASESNESVRYNLTLVQNVDGENESSSSSSTVSALVSTTTQTVECRRNSVRRHGIFRLIKAKSEGNLAEQIQTRRAINTSWSQRDVGLSLDTSICQTPQENPQRTSRSVSTHLVSGAASQTNEDELSPTNEAPPTGNVLYRYYKSLMNNAGVTTPSPVPQVSSFFYAPPPVTGAPPSYSAIMRVNDQWLTENSRNGVRIQPSAPFVAPRPPPTYAESQGVTAPFTRGLYIPSSIIDELIWGTHPTTIVCPVCHQMVLTAVRSQVSSFTHFVAAVFCMFGCWPCCFAPYFIDSCKNVTHYCPNCSTFLGMHRPV